VEPVGGQRARALPALWRAVCSRGDATDQPGHSSAEVFLKHGRGRGPSHGRHRVGERSAAEGGGGWSHRKGGPCEHLLLKGLSHGVRSVLT